LSQHSPARKALNLIADKWTILVIYALQVGPKRLGELNRAIEGVSQKMLIQTLRNMERDGLVTRTVYPVVPPKVEYALTPLGESLKVLTQSLCVWAEAHMAELEAARNHYAQAKQTDV
jgi:DNA-binding HxlR family transcriptional regulator